MTERPCLGKRRFYGLSKLTKKGITMKTTPHGSLEFTTLTSEITQALARETLKIAPVSWPVARLRLTANWNPVTESRAISHMLDHPETGQTAQGFTPTLFEYSEQLHDAFLDSQAAWKEAELLVKREQSVVEDRIPCEVRYTY
jgi:hypothetical protein